MAVDTGDTVTHDLIISLFGAGLAVSGWALLSLSKHSLEIAKLGFRIEKLEKDLNNAHGKIRKMSEDRA